MAQPTTGPDDILPTYSAVGLRWAAERSQELFERPWLDRLLAHAPGRRVLDIGCGAGQPIGTWLHDQGAELTGLDGAAPMCAAYRAALPGVACHRADMRTMDLGQEFDALLAWNSFFYLSPEAQRGMFARFTAHAAPGAVLVFTSGPSASERIGEVGGMPIYHASLNPEDYRALLAANGFTELAYAPEDPECRGHTIWMARFDDTCTGVATGA